LNTATAEQRLRVVEPVNDLEPLFEQLLDEPRLCQPMKQLVPAEQLALWTAKLNFKHSQVGSGFGWHQDAPYWVHDSNHVEKLPNVMVLFDDASAENGCFRVIEGSPSERLFTRL
jgi:ectoine hydroxylase-related dioxygenase (phytanoyl-CoA dioxygenase family)